MKILSFELIIIISFYKCLLPALPGYGTLNQGESDRTADLVSVLAFDVSENTSVSVKIAHSIQLIAIAITTCMNKENVVEKFINITFSGANPTIIHAMQILNQCPLIQLSMSRCN